MATIIHGNNHGRPGTLTADDGQAAIAIARALVRDGLPRRTLSDIIQCADGTEAEQAIAAAYWAGQAHMRGLITEAIATRLQSIPASRYHRLVRDVAEHIATATNINPNYCLRGRGDSGRGEAAEILGWDFAIPRPQAEATRG